MKLLRAALLLLLATPAWAAETVTYENCTDATGRSIPVEAAPNLAVLVQSNGTPEQPVIRHNPYLLPELKPSTRLFFFAHECARLSLERAGDRRQTADRAREADCIGIATLVDAGLVRRESLAELQGDLSFPAEVWALLPGPPRSFNLAACPARGVVRLPPAAAPSARQAGWNACVHACGDRLYHCGKGCRGEACDSRCQEPYRQCVAACDE